MTISRAENAYQDDREPAAATEKPEVTIPVIEERAQVGKQVVETGKVRITKRVSEHEEVIDEPLLREQAAIERVPVNRYVEQAPQPRQEGDTLIIPVVREDIVVQKRLVLVEELHVTKEVVEARDPQTVTLRREEVEITRNVADKDPDG